AACSFGLERLQSSFGLLNDLLIFLGLTEFDHRKLILEFLFDAGNRRQLIFERGALLHGALGTLLVVPEMRIFCELVQLGQSHLRLIEAKDASLAARQTA